MKSINEKWKQTNESLCLTFFSSRKKEENISEWEMITICEKNLKHNKNENKNYLNKYLV